MTTLSTRKARHNQLFQKDIVAYNSCLEEYQKFFDETVEKYQLLDRRITDSLKAHCMSFYVICISAMKNLEYDVNKIVKELQDKQPVYNDFTKVNGTFNVFSTSMKLNAASMRILVLPVLFGVLCNLMKSLLDFDVLPH